MINLDISPIVNAAVAKAVQIEMEKRKDEIEEAIRQAKKEAWDEGYLAFPEGVQQFSNPYRKVNPDATAG